MTPFARGNERTPWSRRDESGTAFVWPSIACLIALTAIGSQWWENHQLRKQLEANSVAHATALEKQATVIQSIQNQRHEERRLIEQNCRAQVRWMEEMREAFANLHESRENAEELAQQLNDERRYKQWNAQSIVSVFNSAASAGVDWRGKSRDRLVEEVLAGMTPAVGPFAGKTFRVPNFSLEEAFLCSPFIALDRDKGLIYDQNGAQPPPSDDSPLTPIAARKPEGKKRPSGPPGRPE
ncbi:hypothetical protein DES53_106325 [Roseimicrobium gellanilyticum]|uniref:Uncharacterized protein n=1 Tax=Roseimicrobium gellanilyticum TaxID=748857 RepID=A0A366HIN0_9BACT|nr:hypothetical protein [Roseimicrobium gellanilyticum]RBP42616.1 hypothetical protein DES53_106325 [Roseimicrobium gellanilyticum]